MDAFPQLPGLWSLTPWGALLGVLVGFFYSLNSSRLYTRRQHDEIVDLHKTASKQWETSSRSWEASSHEKDAQLSAVLPTIEIVGKFFTDVEAKVPEHRDGT